VGFGRRQPSHAQDSEGSGGLWAECGGGAKSSGSTPSGKAWILPQCRGALALMVWLDAKLLMVATKVARATFSAMWNPATSLNSSGP